MPKSTLRSLTVRLAAQRSDLRPALLELLEGVGGLSLRERALVVAATHPEARRAILAAVREADGAATSTFSMMPPGTPSMMPTTTVQAPVPTPPEVPTPAGNQVVQQPTIIIQQPQVAPTPAAKEDAESQPVAAFLVTERTQKGFESDVQPELERLVEAGRTPREAGDELITLIRRAFSQKDMLYNILIRHQSTFETDEEYREGLERLVQTWVSDKTDGV